MKKLITWVALGCLSIATTVVCAQEVQSHSSSSRYHKTTVHTSGSGYRGGNNGNSHRRTYRRSRVRHIHVTQYGNGNTRTHVDRTTTTTRHDVRP
jgi:hypothetical protein